MSNNHCCHPEPLFFCHNNNNDILNMRKEFNIDDPFESMIIRFLNGQLKDEEVDKLNSLIDESPENLEIFRAYQNIWLGSSALLPDERYNTLRAWKSVSRGMEKSANRRLYTSRRASRHIYMGLSKIAALIAAVFIIGAITSYLIFMNFHSLSSDIYTEISVPQGSRSQIVLPDNSRVWLNAGSTIRYPNNFDRIDRVVELDGEAYFDVVSNPRKPFVVSTEHLKFRALGTAFNVKAYPEDEVVSATLVEGNVIVEIPDINDKPLSFNLEPRQNFTYNIAAGRVESAEIIEEIKKETEVPSDPIAEETTGLPEPRILVRTNIRPEIYTSWKDDEWVVEGETMADMAVLLGRRFNTKINIDTEELKRYRFTGRIMNETLEQVLEILRMTTPLKFTVGKGYVDWEIDPDLKEEYDLLLDKQERI